MTRTEFIQTYAKLSGLNDHPYALLGFLDCGNGHVLVAMPCVCGMESCEGWAMLSAEHIDHHMRFNAPYPLRTAYIETVEATNLWAEREEDSEKRP